MKKPKLEGIAHKLARSNILALHPYRCARDDYSSGVLLDANENALGPAAKLDVAQIKLELERYPCPYQVPLKTLYAEYRGVSSPNKIFVGVGSDEAIDLLFRIFCKPGQDNVITTPPTYGMYKVCAAVNDVEVVTVPLTSEFDLRIPEMLAAVTEHTKLMFICSPGNPTAKAIPLEDVIKVANSDYKGLIIVDEAYIDFSSKGSAAQLLDDYPNIVVLQTLSKAFGLAGIRLGFALGNEDVIQLMNNVKAPYNVNSMTSEVARNAINNIESLNEKVNELLVQRDIVMSKLEQLDYVVKVHPSDSNFVLFQVKEKAFELYKTMADRGVVTRFRGNEMHCNECIRVTIGSEEENSTFLELMTKIWEELK
eukprot:CAMPEP_0196825220 /NCGR_PEP_ID=MMETSP1362-20130617/92919_1 /TAXON_ID=163516 /ORGANISM="Leptocylindrus danicus, Strain CCMP1856" /LENGTH=366 /DNA_ID=CAMNT_0042205601 /DNA_START=187 /DNA_END=1287 /DNA_ORIENTATION=+